MDDGYFHGINKMKKPGFKVIKPPGGQTQINIFEQQQEIKSSPINPCQAERNSSNVFSHQGATPVKSNADRNASSIIFAGPELSAPPASAPAAAPAPAPAPAAPAPTPTAPKATNTKTAPAAPPAASTPAKPTNNATPQCTPDANRMSGNPPPQRSSTKVIAPPGGRSSINLFG